MAAVKTVNMKKVFIVSLFSLFFINAFAQKNVSIGPIAGFGHAWISGGEGDNRYKPSGNVGLQLVYSAIGNFGIGGNLVYSIEGGSREIGNVKYTTRLNYLRIPVTAMYFFGQLGDRVRPKVSIGPSVGFLVGGEQDLNGVINEDVKDDFKKIDIGIHATAGFHFRLISNTWLTLDMNYYNGMSDITEVNQKNKNRNIGLNAGLLFGLTQHRERY